MKRMQEQGNEPSYGKAENKIRCIWTEEEDKALFETAEKYKGGYWNSVAKLVSEFTPAGEKKKSSKQCRERWHNQINPVICDEPVTEKEAIQVFALHEQFGNMWSKISDRLQGRTDNVIKNFFLCKLRKLVRCIKKDTGKEVLTATNVDIEQTLYLLDNLYKYYVSPNRVENKKKTLNSQIKRRKNHGDKYINRIIEEEGLTSEKISSFLKKLIPTPPTSLKKSSLEQYSHLINLASTDTNKYPCSVCSMESPPNLSHESSPCTSSKCL